MKIKIEDYIKLSKSERQKHIEIESSCFERGECYRTVLSISLNTTIPRGHKIHCCHVCNNRKCSNPKHLYWGTAGENVLDTWNAPGKLYYIPPSKEDLLKIDYFLLYGK